MIGLCILLWSCGTPAVLPDIESSATNSITTAPSAWVSATATVTHISAITQTLQPALTLPPGDTPSPTIQISALPEATAQAQVENLLKTNANCRLPCWWGITPGLSNLTAASQILDPLGGASKKTPVGWEYLFSDRENGIFISQYLILDDDIVEMIEILFGGTSVLSLSDILAEYGPPTEIYIRTFSNQVQGITPFYLILFYADQGIVARFENNNASLTDTTVQMCFHQEPVWGMVLWSPGDEQTYWEVAEIAKTVGMGGLKMIICPSFQLKIQLT